MQFVSVKFNPGDVKAYTYHHEGDETLTPGQEIEIPSRAGWRKAAIFAVGIEEPEYATKPIKLIEPEEAAEEGDGGAEDQPASTGGATDGPTEDEGEEIAEPANES